MTEMNESKYIEELSDRAVTEELDGGGSIRLYSIFAIPIEYNNKVGQLYRVISYMPSRETISYILVNDSLIGSKFKFHDKDSEETTEGRRQFIDSLFSPNKRSIVNKFYELGNETGVL